MVSVVCYQDKYQLYQRLTNQLLHDSLGNEFHQHFGII